MCPLPAVRRASCFPGAVVVPPLPGIEPDDLVTPKRAAELLGIPVGTVSSWITRYGIEPLGKAGRWHVYDFREIAAIEARPRQPKIAA